MNKQTRAEVQKLLEALEDLKAQTETIGEQLRTIADAEQEKFENLSEGLQSSDMGQKIETAAGVLDSAAGAAENGNAAEAITELEELEA